MIQKIILTIVLSCSLLFSEELIGTWQLDMPKMQQTMPMEKMEESKQFVVAMFADMWSHVVFNTDGTFQLIDAKQKGIWKENGDAYVVQASVKAPSNKVVIVDKKHMKILFDDAHVGLLTFYFKKSSN